MFWKGEFVDVTGGVGLRSRKGKERKGREGKEQGDLSIGGEEAQEACRIEGMYPPSGRKTPRSSDLLLSNIVHSSLTDPPLFLALELVVQQEQGLFVGFRSSDNSEHSLASLVVRDFGNRDSGTRESSDFSDLGTSSSTVKWLSEPLFEGEVVSYFSRNQDTTLT